MPNKLYEENDIRAIANAIREKGHSGTMLVSEMAQAITDLPSGTEITDGIVVKVRDVNGFATEVDLYAQDGILHNHLFGVYYGSNVNQTAGTEGVKKISKINNKNPIVKVENAGLANSGIGIDWEGFSTLKETGIMAFANCDNVIGVLVLPELVKVGGYSFWGMDGITEIHCPKLPNAYSENGFSNNANLKKITMPVAEGAINGGTLGAFRNNKALEELIIGGIGHTSWSEVNAYGAFTGCTQSGLTITIYTDNIHGGKNSTYPEPVDYMVSQIRKSATNATIIIKASVDTNYNGVSYSAGETILTSEVTA